MNTRKPTLRESYRHQRLSVLTNGKRMVSIGFRSIERGNFSNAPAIALGAWLRMLKFSMSRDGSTTIPDCADYDQSDWLMLCRITLADVDAARDAGLAEWSGTNLVLNDIDDPDGDARERSLARNERMKLAKSVATHTDLEWSDLVEKCGRRCVRCGADGSLAKDHIVPVFMGGSDGIENVQPLCTSCNSSKRDETIDHRPEHARPARNP